MDWNLFDLKKVMSGMDYVEYIGNPINKRKNG
jgi:hypothetical protein